jgi:hypothetical protein
LQKTAMICPKLKTGAGRSNHWSAFSVQPPQP